MRAASLHHAVRGVFTAALAAACFFGGGAFAGEVLEVRLSESVPGGYEVGVRDAAGQLPRVTIAESVIPMTATAPTPSLRWQPLVIFVDTANVSGELLDRIKTNVENVVKRQFDGGAQLVVVADQIGNKYELKDPATATKNLKDLMASWTPVEVPKKLKYAPTNVASFLPKALASVLVPRGRPWALVYSSLCVADDEAPGDLSVFKGPVRFLTWDHDLDGKCLDNRATWLKATQGDNREVFHLDKPEDKDRVGQALLGLQIDDATLTLSGWNYEGGNFNITVGYEGEPSPWTGSFTTDVVPQSWSDAASDRRSKRSKMVAAGGLTVLVALLMGFALAKARTGAAEVAKWEAVGEAEDLSTNLDPDAWNATIFQLTGAMPVIQELQAAAQLGPGSTKGENARPTRQEASEDLLKAAEAANAKAAAQIGKDTTASPSMAKDTAPPMGDGASKSSKSTGMTVAMPVLDDGTGYDANRPFEIGVLLSGKPVARKTKKFRKVFSIGRATDNRVVIQKDDTVHRYHVVVRPALQGKEWWLEVSPTATNRTNLNGKDLRAGGRYRLPNRFRLQLGEATEVRGRLSDG